MAVTITIPLFCIFLLVVIIIFVCYLPLAGAEVTQLCNIMRAKVINLLEITKLLPFNL
jgi:hypothetical protein